MNDAGKAKTPWHLWVVGVLTLAWNAFGATDYTMTQTGNRGWFANMGFDEATTDAMLDFIAAAPAWTDAAWAIGVWGGVVGSILLLARSRWAIPVYAASVIGVIGSMIYQAQAEYPPELSEMGNSPIMYIVLTIAVALLLYAIAMRRRGTLG